MYAITAIRSCILSTTFLVLSIGANVKNTCAFLHGDGRLHRHSSNYYRKALTPAFATIPEKTVSSSRDNLLSYAEQLFSDSGPFLRDEDSLKQLKKMVAELEALCDAPTTSNVDQIVGDWKLLCTTDSFEREQISPPSLLLPDFVKDRLENSALKKSVRESVRVVQRIRTDGGKDNGDDSISAINRVDNVIELTPPTLTDVLPFDVPVSVLNPLEVTKTKVSLIHTAEVESISPVLRTKLALESIVLNVAGESQFLEADGDDVLGLNVPLGDFLNFGSFDTTFVDDTLRISRGKTGFVDQLRVFVREGGVSSAEVVVEEEEMVTEAQQLDEESTASLTAAAEDEIPPVNSNAEDEEELSSEETNESLSAGEKEGEEGDSDDDINPESPESETV